jgi:hypothetical protein
MLWQMTNSHYELVAATDALPRAAERDVSPCQLSQTGLSGAISILEEKIK